VKCVNSTLLGDDLNTVMLIISGVYYFNVVRFFSYASLRV